MTAFTDTFRDNPNDYQILVAALLSRGAIVFGWSADNETAYVVTLVREFSVMGPLPFGGNPDGCILVGVLGRGFFWFHPTYSPSVEYLEEKLSLSKRGAKDIYKLLSGIFAVGGVNDVKG